MLVAYANTSHCNRKVYSGFGRRRCADGHRAAHVAQVASAVARGLSAAAEYAPAGLGKRTCFDCLR